MRNRLALVTFAALPAVSLLLGQQSSTLLEHVPASAASLVNPYEGSSEAVQAGGKLYRRHCAACHGNQREGRGRVPALRTEVVTRASPGTLFWVLKNGSLVRGMPAWSKLPDQQRWQIVAYLMCFAKTGVNPPLPGESSRSSWTRSINGLPFRLLLTTAQAIQRRPSLRGTP